MPTGTYTSSGYSDYNSAWRYVQSSFTYAGSYTATTSGGYFHTSTASFTPPTPRETELPEIDRDAWSDFMDSVGG